MGALYRLISYFKAQLEPKILLGFLCEFRILWLDFLLLCDSGLVLHGIDMQHERFFEVKLINLHISTKTIQLCT
jgi:hypothetical protein